MAAFVSHRPAGVGASSRCRRTRFPPVPQEQSCIGPRHPATKRPAPKGDRAQVRPTGPMQPGQRSREAPVVPAPILVPGREPCDRACAPLDRQDENRPILAAAPVRERHLSEPDLPRSWPRAPPPRNRATQRQQHDRNDDGHHQLSVVGGPTERRGAWHKETARQDHIDLQVPRAATPPHHSHAQRHPTDPRSFVPSRTGFAAICGPKKEITNTQRGERDRATIAPPARTGAPMTYQRASSTPRRRPTLGLGAWRSSTCTTGYRSVGRRSDTTSPIASRAARGATVALLACVALAAILVVALDRGPWTRWGVPSVLIVASIAGAEAVRAWLGARQPLPAQE